MSPLPPILHLVALAAGLFGGLSLISWIAPDLPSGDPGVVETGEGQVVGPGDSDSLLMAGNFATALVQVRDQLGSGQKVSSLRVTPGEFSVEASEEGIDIDELATSAPYLIAYQIGEEREDVQGPQDLREVRMRATPAGPSWQATLRDRLPPPLVYEATIPGPTVVAFEVTVRPVAGS